MESICTTIRAAIYMPYRHYVPETPCFCNIYLNNHFDHPIENMKLVVLLEHAGQFSFFPLHTESPELPVTLQPGEWPIKILKDFNWPELQSMSGAKWYTALFENNLDYMVSDINSYKFSWSY